VPVGRWRNAGRGASGAYERLKHLFDMPRRSTTYKPAGRPPGKTHNAREKLLEAAGRLFAERGARAVGVREICRRAAVNVAAVHYHFGGKQELYEELLRLACQARVARHPLDGEQDRQGPPSRAEPPEERLRRFVHDFLKRTLASDSETAWQRRLLSREMLDPSSACEPLLEAELRPLFKRLCALVAECLGKRATPELAILCARSIAGQCLFYDHSGPLLAKLSPGEQLGPRQIAKLAEHIASFSLHGLAGPP
jgi:TetR/AcrR family transcriptional regulator, regulator of cefoperazone and chloramphenicol sensitivity